MSIWEFHRTSSSVERDQERRVYRRARIKPAEPKDGQQVGRETRARVLKYTGIPTGVGIATTKTLAKLANHSAKKWQRQTGGVVDLRDPDRRDKVLRVLSVSDVWGVGRRMTEHLNVQGIKTAWDLARA